MISMKIEQVYHFNTRDDNRKDSKEETRKVSFSEVRLSGPGPVTQRRSESKTEQSAGSESFTSSSICPPGKTKLFHSAQQNDERSFLDSK